MLLLLEAARLYRPKRPDLALPCAFTIIAVLLLTGMRPSEGLGLLVEDLDFDRGVIRVRRNRFRRLKTRRSRRVVPMWPQLKSILLAYLEARGNPSEGILFPSPKRPGMLVRSIKRLVATLSGRIGYKGRLTPRVFRHTYCAARLETLDGDMPVSTFKVARELGHKGTSMVIEIYGHVRQGVSGRPRKPYVEYLVDDYPEILADRLQDLQARSELAVGPAVVLENRVPLATELAVITAAGEAPYLGQKKVAAELGQRGLEVSSSGVRWIWKRYGLHRAEYRLEAVRTGRLAEIIEEVQRLRTA